MQAPEMKFLRSLKVSTRLDHLTNDSLRSDLKNYINHKIKVYHHKWKKHMERIDKDRLPRKLTEYKSKGYQNRGRPLHSWSDQCRGIRLRA